MKQPPSKFVDKPPSSRTELDFPLGSNAWAWDVIGNWKHGEVASVNNGAVCVDIGLTPDIYHHINSDGVWPSTVPKRKY
jgi:hypothetical protein